MPLLRMENINAGYGRTQILFDINLKIEEGSITACIGPNGSGKSTLLKTIFGLVTIYSGLIRFDGRDITNLEPFNKPKIGIAYLMQVENIFSILTVKENLAAAGHILSNDEAESRVKAVLEMFPILKDCMDKTANKLSGGERQMLALAIALARKPKLIMIDEPTTSLAPKVSYQIYKKIEEINDKENITVFMVDQNVKQALKLAKYTYLLVDGRIKFEGEANKLLEHRELAKLYLGIA